MAPVRFKFQVIADFGVKLLDVTGLEDVAVDVVEMEMSVVVE